MARIFTRSWSAIEAPFELDKLKKFNSNSANSIQDNKFYNEWINAHTDYQKININDVWLTTNGLENIPGAGFKQISWYAESYIYNKENYDNFETDKRFDLRFHFNPNMCEYPRTLHLPIFTWWENEIELYKETVKNKKPEFNFGMVLAHKPTNRLAFPSCYLGWIRAEIVKAGRGRSMKYYGPGWSKEDPNYAGEAYIAGHARHPDKFHDARILMTKAKFVFAIENTHDNYYSENYLTEKMWHGFISASVPIYVGCCNVEEMIDPSLFIDIRKFNYDISAVMDYCEKMSENEYQGYLSRIGEFLENEGQAFTGESVFIQMDRKIHNFLMNG